MDGPTHDACVVGSGPAGLASALALADRGLRVLLVESGHHSYNAAIQALSDAEIATPQSHADMADAVRRGLGGTSALWGGRCLPLDALDFEARAHVPGSGWPIRSTDLEPYLAEASRFLGAGEPSFQVQDCRALLTADRPLAQGLGHVAGVSTSSLERWSGVPNVWAAHGVRVRTHPLIDLCAGWTCVGLEHESAGGAVRRARLARRSSDSVETRRVAARAFVIACGGIESTRLVLDSLQTEGGLRLPKPALVGSHYMGHLSGKVADIQLRGPPAETLFGFETDGGVYVRRRLSLLPQVLAAAGLQNIVFWFDNPPIHEASHGSGVLSAAYLALSAPLLGSLLAPSAIRKRARSGEQTQWLAHLRNCARSPWSSLAFCARFARARYWRRPRLPGFFTYSPSNRYALHFHAEHAPSVDSRITLSEQRDALGLRRVKVALRWADRDLDSVVRAHIEMNRCLQHDDAAKLCWRYPAEALHEAVRKQSVDGFHQIGTLRMAASADSGVTDSDGRFFGTRNLFAASSAIFPTSGQANPTLSLVALTLRQAAQVERVAVEARS